MGEDLGGRDFIEEMSAEGTRGDEAVTDATDAPNITEMGDVMDIPKMEYYMNSTINGHNSKVR